MACTTATLLAIALAPAPDVHTGYASAYRQARENGKLLLIDFESGLRPARLDEQQLEDYVFCRLPLDYEIEQDGERQRLLDCGAFSDLRGSPGLVIVDLQHADNPDLFRHTVSVLPKKFVTEEHVDALLDLPPGTLTQRTLIWAFRVHPERPQSVYGTPHPRLMDHCRRHCREQCRQRKLHHCLTHPGRCEIVAVSWPWNRNLVEAAIDIVASWRGSAAHWEAASGRWTYYGYDMQTNGEKWYATGVFE